jgi:alpha-D-ribose 1-methylphosphonate 5-triphosphate synthase subunit PhnG
MKRRRRTEILIKGSAELARRFSVEIEENYSIKVIQVPENGLVMVKMREAAQKSLFYLGEVFVTEAKVQIKDELGIGIVTGNNQELAYDLAVIDAAYNAGLAETRNWEHQLLDEEIKIKKIAEKEQGKIMMTKVNFETMDV